MTTPNYSFVLIRGLIRETEHWGPFVGQLQEAFPGSTVHGLDLPGAGRHFRDRTPLSVEGMVHRMRQDLLSLPIEKARPRVLIAVSLGGMVASQWMQDFPQDFQRIVLINTSFAQFNPPWQRLRPEALKALLPVLALQGIQREKRILQVVSNRPEHYAEVARTWARIQFDRPVSKLNGLRQLLAAFRFNSRLKTTPVPALVLASTRDRMVSVECSKSIAEAWNLPIRFHPNAGHDLTTDDPSWAVREVRSWLSTKG